ncbi:hypothetical protein C0J52_22187 [Blattella germanica]|nr:hypothetical protein C0J52_22187 [Blattella germanica]PSN30724.1 hypothetical protein C0J52_22187 [Blattella germanica]PSN30725.1 hypothetical protein C0J52_22187 [Blattella germanica]
MVDDYDSAIKYPISLSDLAMQRFGMFLSDLTRKLVKMVQCSPLDNSNIEYIQENCKYLEELISKTVPTNLANEICAKLQTYVLRSYLIDSGYFSPYHLHDQTFEDEFYCTAWIEVALEVLLAVLHPKVTSFSFVSRTILADDVPTFAVPYLCRVMKKLKCIKEINLDVVPIERGTFIYYLLKHTELKELTFIGCTDTTLKLCYDFDLQFTKLDLRNSNISDSCIPYLLKFENLEYLDILHSYITEEGVTELMQGLSKINCKIAESNQLCKRNFLKTFKSELSSSQVYHIGNYLPNLTCLDICLHWPLNLLPLRNLKKLTNLTVGVHGKSSSIPFIGFLHNLLREIGHQLLELNVIKIDVDLEVIAQNCPSLERLGLKLVNRSLVHSNQNGTILPSVQFCELSTYFVSDDYVQFVFSCLSNVKVLKLTFNRHDYSHALFDDILERMRLGKLRELFMEDYKIILRCRNLVVTLDNNYLAFITRDVNFREVLAVLERNEAIQMPKTQE